ncbi:hypothetical protein AAC387_Pa04g1845 [Persea americana]
MGLVPCSNGCLSQEEPQSTSSSHLYSTDSASLSSQPSLPTVPSLTTSQIHRPPTHHQCISTLKAHSSPVFSLTLSAKSLYSGSSNGEILLWPTQPTSCPTSNIVTVGKAAVKSVAVLHNKLITAHQDHKIRVWEIDRGYKLSATLPTLLDRVLRFLPPKNHVQVRRHKKCTWVHHVDSVSALALSTDGTILYSVSWDRTLKIWRTNDFRCMESVANAHDDAINALAISQEGFIYTGSADTRIKVWTKGPAQKKHSLHATLEKHRSAVNALALSPDGSVLYSGACDRSIVVWERDLSSRNGNMVVVGALRGHTKAILCLGVVKGGDMVCSGSADRTVRVWMRGADRAYSCLAVLDGHAGPVKCLAVGLDRGGGGGTSVVVYSGGLDRDIKVWQVSSQDPL